MAQTRYTQLPPVQGLDGNEVLSLDQSDGAGGYVTRRTTTAAVAELALNGLPEYSDDVTAAAGGIEVGGSYFSTTIAAYTRRRV